MIAAVLVTVTGACRGGDEARSGGGPVSLPSTTAPAARVPTCVAVIGGRDIQSIVDDHPPGTTYCLSGMHVLPAPIRPHDGDAFRGPATLDGGDVVAHAFVGDENHIVGVEVRDLVIQHFDSPLQTAALVKSPGAGWVIEGNEVAYNSAVGVEIFDGGRVAGNHIHDNGQLGLFAYRAAGSLVEGNEIDHNNTGLHDQSWEAGGIKVAGTVDIVIRGNDIHDNWGKGVWLDTDDTGYVIEANRITNNSSSGIKLEHVGAGTVVDNAVSFSGMLSPNPFGGDGINVDDSGPVLVRGNSVACSQRANFAYVNGADVTDGGGNIVPLC